ncbi:Bardet-Biedl syndrome 4 protein [Podochytrium sp. JEL0797]|nr:Bardet-Biedl syndrome 4 protein [Podochytrium sp. JEL0797]
MIAILHQLHASHRTRECEALIERILINDASNPDDIQEALFVKEAIEIYNQAIHHCSDDWVLHFRKGECLQSIKDYSNAELCMLTALSLHRHESVFKQLGELFILQDNYDAALQIYQEAIK